MLPSRPWLLFTAPLDFDPVVMREYEAFMPVWWSDREQSPVGMPEHEDTTVYVCSPRDWFMGEKELGWYPNLHILATASTGTNHIDLDACARRGIKVISLLDDRAGLETISASAEWTFKLILEGLRLKRPYHELQGRTVGLVGYGRIGRNLARWCTNFGAPFQLAYDPPALQYSDALQDVFSCQIVVICCALTPETTGMIGYDLLKLLPQDAVLVNTARGEVIDEDALLRVMAERPDLRVCLDVVSGEVTGKSDPSSLRGLGAIVTPHIAGDTFESRTKAARIVLRLLQHAREAGNGAASPAAEVAYAG